jgi:hypothetical protein
MKVSRTIAKDGLLRKARTLTSNISYGGEGREIPADAIHKVRTHPFLDEEHGVDSAAFYANMPMSTDEFTVTYRKAP